MSLKAFHVFFVAVAVLFCLGLSGWGALTWRAEHAPLAMGLAVSGTAGALALLVYGRWMLKKLAKESYL